MTDDVFNTDGELVEKLMVAGRIRDTLDNLVEQWKETQRARLNMPLSLNSR